MSCSGSRRSHLSVIRATRWFPQWFTPQRAHASPHTGPHTQHKIKTTAQQSAQAYGPLLKKMKKKKCLDFRLYTIGNSWCINIALYFPQWQASPFSSLIQPVQGLRLPQVNTDADARWCGPAGSALFAPCLSGKNKCLSPVGAEKLENLFGSANLVHDLKGGDFTRTKQGNMHVSKKISKKRF